MPPIGDEQHWDYGSLELGPRRTVVSLVCCVLEVGVVVLVVCSVVSRSEVQFGDGRSRVLIGPSRLTADSDRSISLVSGLCIHLPPQSTASTQPCVHHREEQRLSARLNTPSRSPSMVRAPSPVASSRLSAQGTLPRYLSATSQAPVTQNPRPTCSLARRMSWHVPDACRG